MAGEGSPTPFEIPCGLLHGILHDVRSGIEGYRGGYSFVSDPGDLGQGRDIYIYIYFNKE